MPVEESKMKKIIITGATGFIGKNTLYKILDMEDFSVSVLVRQPSHNKIPKDNRINIYIGDILNKESLIKAFNNKDILIHCAGYIGRDKGRLFRVNAQGVENVLSAARQAKIKKTIYLSSVSVISANKGVIRDSMPYKASNIYGESKIAGEKIAWEYINKGLGIVILRPAMVYGPGEPHLIPKLCWLLKKRLFPLIGEADNKWHLCAVENLLRAIQLSLLNENMLNRAFIVADEEILTVKDVIGLLAKSIGAKRPFIIPKRLAHILCKMPLPVARKFITFFSKNREYDISNLKNTGWRQVVSPWVAIGRAKCI